MTTTLTLHTCAMCQRTAPWGPSWSWRFTRKHRGQDEVTVCSDDCAGAYDRHEDPREWMAAKEALTIEDGDAHAMRLFRRWLLSLSLADRRYVLAWQQRWVAP